MEPIEKNAKTILVVEDEEGVRELVSEFLSLEGYRILEAVNGREAVRTSERHEGPIHLLLSDVVMPEMNGFEVGRIISAERPEMKVIYMSGYTNVDNYELENMGTDTVLLQKPISAVALVAAVNEALGCKG